MKTAADFKVGDKVWYVDGGRIKTGVIADNGKAEYGCFVTPSWNHLSRDEYVSFDSLFQRPSDFEGVRHEMIEHMRTVKYDLENFLDLVGVASELDTVSGSFVDVEDTKTGEGTARCSKCRVKFDYSIFVDYGVRWDTERGLYILFCENCGVESE